MGKRDAGRVGTGDFRAVDTIEGVLLMSGQFFDWKYCKKVVDEMSENEAKDTLKYLIEERNFEAAVRAMWKKNEPSPERSESSGFAKLPRDVKG